MNNLIIPEARDFGWNLKPVASSVFDIHKRENGQFSVVLNHSLLMGVTSEMIHWWFLNFPNLIVRLRDVPKYDDKQVPAYLLWHPVDHISAEFSGALGPNNSAKPGSSIHIREVMQYDVYDWKYPVDTQLKVFYVGKDGWAMGKILPFIGPVMMLRIHFKDVFDGTTHLGVHYHYEVVIGASGTGLISRQVNKKLTSHFGSDFFAAWQRHNVIEVGTFENFLPALYAQKDKQSNLEYTPDMNPIPIDSEQQSAFSADLFKQRLAGYGETDNPYVYQHYEDTSFL